MWEWMAWTPPVAFFFAGVALMLLGMTVWEVVSPSVLRRGFLPMATTRGDRLFVGLLGAAFSNLALVGCAGWLAEFLSLAAEPSVWWSFAFSVVLVVWVVRKG